MRRAVRVVGWTLLSVVVVFLVLCTAGEIRQRVLVHRAKALMVDIQSLDDHKSTWADAQRLMTKWGKWGRYEGSCTAVDCMYTVSLPLPRLHPEMEPTKWEIALYALDRLRLRPRQFGGGLQRVGGMFLVQDGVVRRKGLAMTVIVAPLAKGRDTGEGGISLFLNVIERGSLEGEHLSEPRQALHPDFGIFQPSGCEGCAAATATLVSGRGDQFAAMSDFRFDCVTGWNSCTTLEQMNSSVTRWYVHGPPWNRKEEVPYFSDDPRPFCPVPVYSLARDASSIVVVQALADSGPSQRDDSGLAYYVGTRVKVLSVVRGEGNMAVGNVIPLASLGRDVDGTPGIPVKLHQGDVVAMLLRSGRPAGSYYIRSCEVFPWNASTQGEIARGIAMRDPIRGPEPVVLSSGFIRDREWSGWF